MIHKTDVVINAVEWQERYYAEGAEVNTHIDACCRGTHFFFTEGASPLLRVHGCYLFSPQARWRHRYNKDIAGNAWNNRRPLNRYWWLFDRLNNEGGSSDCDQSQESRESSESRSSEEVTTTDQTTTTVMTTTPTTNGTTPMTNGTTADGSSTTPQPGTTTPPVFVTSESATTSRRGDNWATCFAFLRLQIRNDHILFIGTQMSWLHWFNFLN